MGTLKIVPADAARWKDLQTVFGTRGGAAACQCQRAILPRREYWHMPRDLRRDFLHEEIVAARAAARGLIAYAGDEPVGWCRLGPRRQFAPLRNSPVPWAERREDKEDATVWAVVSFVVRVGYRRRAMYCCSTRRKVIASATRRGWRREPRRCGRRKPGARNRTEFRQAALRKSA